MHPDERGGSPLTSPAGLNIRFFLGAALGLALGLVESMQFTSSVPWLVASTLVSGLGFGLLARTFGEGLWGILLRWISWFV